MYDKLKDDERQTLDIDFVNNPDILRGKYLDINEGVQSEVLNTTRFDESLDLSTTYLRRTDITKKLKTKQKKSLLYQNKDTWWENC